MDLEFSIHRLVQTRIDGSALIFHILIVTSGLIGTVKSRGQRQLLIDPVASAFRVISCPGECLKILNGPAVHNVPAKMDREVAGQSRVLIEHFLIPVVAEACAVSVIGYHQTDLLSILENPH